MAIVCGQPLDVVRIQQQTNPLAPVRTGAAFKALIQLGGLQSLLKGAAFPIGSIAFQSALTFQAYGAASRFLAGGEQQNSLSQVGSADCHQRSIWAPAVLEGVSFLEMVLGTGLVKHHRHALHTPRSMQAMPCMHC